MLSRATEAASGSCGPPVCRREHSAPSASAPGGAARRNRVLGPPLGSAWPRGVSWQNRCLATRRAGHGAANRSRRSRRRGGRLMSIGDQPPAAPRRRGWAAPRATRCRPARSAPGAIRSSTAAARRCASLPWAGTRSAPVRRPALPPTSPPSARQLQRRARLLDQRHPGRNGWIRWGGPDISTPAPMRPVRAFAQRHMRSAISAPSAFHRSRSSGSNDTAVR